MDTVGEFLENLFVPNKNKGKCEDEIPMKPVEKPPEIKITKKVTVMWKKDGSKEVFENVSDFGFKTNKLVHISFKDEADDTIRRIYVPVKEVSRFDLEWIKT
jgi:hypothetical protein